MEIQHFIESEQVGIFMQKNHNFSNEEVVNIIILGNRHLSLAEKLTALRELLPQLPNRSTSAAHVRMIQEDLEQHLLIPNKALVQVDNKDGKALFVASLHSIKECLEQELCNTFDESRSFLLEKLQIQLIKDTYEKYYSMKIEKWTQDDNGILFKQLLYSLNRNGEIETIGICGNICFPAVDKVTTTFQYCPRLSESSFYIYDSRMLKEDLKQFLKISDRALEEVENEDGKALFLASRNSIEGWPVMTLDKKLCYSFVEARKFLQDTKYSCEKEFLLEIEKWIPDSNGMLFKHLCYHLNGQGDIVYYEFENEYEIRLCRGTKPMRYKLPFKNGDLVEIDNRPFGPCIHGVFFYPEDNGEEPFECSQYLIYIDQERSETLAFHFLLNGGGLPWSRVSTYTGTFEKEEAVLQEISKCLKTDPKKTLEIDDIPNRTLIYKKQYLTLDQILESAKLEEAKRRQEDSLSC